MKKATVIKMGGSRMDRLDDLLDFLKQSCPRQTVVVHGGGPAISTMLERLQLQAVFKEGLRTTDAATMEVVEMVLAGQVNKGLVGRLQAAGLPAVGLSGLDGATVRSRVYRDGELGRVGEVDKVETGLLLTLLNQGYLPVLCPLGLGPDGASYNINADSVAAAVAGALPAERLVYLTDVAGLLDREGELIEQVTPEQIRGLIKGGVIAGGMIPKLEGAVRALESGVSLVEIRSTSARGTVLKGENHVGGLC